MTHSLYMDIAGIHFAASSAQPISAENLPETYAPFIKVTESPSSDMNVIISIKTGLIPDTRHMTRVFDTEQSWSLRKQQDHYFLSLKVPGEEGQLIWLAEFRNHINRVTLYCPDRFIGEKTLSVPIGYPLDQLLLMHILPERDGLLVHSAGLGINGRGCIFPGRSGAGKSTISRIFSGRDGIESLSDDRIIIRKIDGRFIAFGTPWAGDAGIAENRGIRLESIFFIHHAEKNIISDLSRSEAVRRLIPVSSIPWYDEDAVSNILAFCEDLVSAVPAYDLNFRPDQDIANMLEDFIAGDRI